MTLRFFAGGGTTVRLPRQIPFAQAMEFLLCADQIDARRALDMGLLNAVVAEEVLLDKAFEYAARITKNAPLAVQATKRSALEGLKLDMREFSHGICLRSIGIDGTACCPACWLRPYTRRGCLAAVSTMNIGHALNDDADGR